VNEHHKTVTEIAEEMQLVLRAQQDPIAFAPLYEKYFHPVFVFIWRRTSDEELSADICQQVFLKAMLHIKKFSPKGVPFSAWLFRIAFNEVNMYFRKHPNGRTLTLKDEHSTTLLAECGNPDDSEMKSVLLKSITELGPEDVQLIELRFFEERAFAEVADILGITENNAKVRTYRAIDKLKELVKKRL
jgi:RNA polymerase sigma-70 factor, ECF subfamily